MYSILCQSVICRSQRVLGNIVKFQCSVFIQLARELIVHSTYRLVNFLKMIKSLYTCRYQVYIYIFFFHKIIVLNAQKHILQIMVIMCCVSHLKFRICLVFSYSWILGLLKVVYQDQVMDKKCGVLKTLVSLNYLLVSFNYSIFLLCLRKIV